MLIGTGVDLVEISRVKRAVERWNGAFLARVFTPAELELADRSGARRFERLAVRFAAKEAVMKAIGTGWARGVGWREIEVSTGESGAPSVRLSGRAAEAAKERGIEMVHVALSHSGDVAIATAHAESLSPPR